MVLFGISGVWRAQKIPNDPEYRASHPKKSKRRDKLMRLHKSAGVTVLMLLPFRFASRMLTRLPAPPAGPKWEIMMANINHYALYGLTAWMPLTGFGMGYFSGYGVPFFSWDIPGASPEKVNRNRSGTFYKLHTNAGKVLEFLIPLHLGGVVWHHIVRRTNLLQRMTINPATRRAAKVNNVTP